MKNKKVSLKHLGIGILFVISYFLFANIISYLLVKTNYFTLNNIAILYLVTYSLTLLIYLVIFNKELLSNYNNFKKNYKKYIRIAFNYWIKGLFVMMASNIILNLVLKTGQSTNQLENLNLLKNNLLAHSFTIVLIAPLIEEIVFRLSFKKMSKDTKIFAFTTGIIFGFVHIISSLNLTNPLNILMLIPYSSMGVALGYAYKETDNIFSSLIMHILHNTLTLIIMIIAIKGGII